jgi:flagellar L-ring protein precursor FlgH
LNHTYVTALWWCLVVSLGLNGFMGCANLEKPAPSETEISLQAETPERPSGSLWDEDNSRAYMFEDRRAGRVGDIVVVKIVEQHSGSKKANTVADRESSYEAAASGTLFGLNQVLDTLAEVFGADINSKSEFEGDGSTSREDTLTGTIAAQVIEVFPNGDLRIKGKREVTVNSEKQTMTIKGIVRRIDLDTANTVLSTAVANAEISYTGLGVVDDVQRPGWLMRIWNWVTPL